MDRLEPEDVAVILQLLSQCNDATRRSSNTFQMVCSLPFWYFALAVLRSVLVLLRGLIHIQRCLFCPIKILHSWCGHIG